MDGMAKQMDHMKRQVLVVDDEFVNRQLLGYILSQKFDVLYAENGKEALELIRQKKDILSLVLLDLMMPELDGFEVLRITHEDDELRRIPIIVLTSEKNAEVKSLELGAHDFITKPYDMPEIILARVTRTIELSEDKNLIRSTERDDLTGLYVRKFFFEYARQMEKYHPDWEMDSVVIDIDHFHLINELYGRSFGDEVLKRIAEVLQEFLGTCKGLGCRRESDTFYLYCERQEDYGTLRHKILVGLSKLAVNRRIHFRLGVYSISENKLDLEQRFDAAKLACDTIRNNFTQFICYYSTKMHESSLYAERLVNDIDKAIEERQLKVFYQPKYGIQADKPYLKSAEALIRWEHPDLGMINPGVFIPLFEENGLIQIVDHYVWKEVGRQIKEWKDTYGITLPVSVNISRIDIYDPELEDKLMNILEENGLTTDGYLLEITESAYTDDSDQLLGVVNSLRERGFKVEMDDFGSGYSSLNMLTMMPIDALKLDMKFIRNVHRDKKSFRLIELILDIAKYLNVPVIAEGVEEEEQFHLLKQAGCDVIQGYYFSKPVPPIDFTKFFSDEES